MAEAVVSLAVERITDLLIQEPKCLSGVRREVTRLKDELKRMQCFLKDADSKQDQDGRVRNWVAEIRGIAYDAEDVIDTFIHKASASRGKGACGLVKSVTSTFTKAFDFQKIRNQIEAIRTKIGDISASMKTYGIQFVAEKERSSSTRELQQRLRRSYPHEEEEHIVSFKPIARDLKAQLMIEEDRLCVVSVAGMGGLGKTTLAKKVYNDIHVKQHFDCYGWAFVSQQVSVKNILVRIMIDVASSEVKSRLERSEEKKPFDKMKDEQSFKSVLESMDEEDLTKKLYEVLEEKRYLVVLDDIWSNEAWDCLKHAFPNGKKGSKVLLTTRNREVASYADPWSPLFEPPLLTSEEGWELLCRKAFQRDVILEHGYSPEFEKLGKDQMVKRCGGLPLAVVVLGGLLATKKSLNEWEVVNRNINVQFAKLQRHHQYGGVYGLLALSYHDLPFHLKPCFLYLSQFPEDWKFHKRSLIRLWIAEGFVPQTTQADGDETVEEVAEQYLEELASRCMVQVSQRNHIGTGIKTFCMHDLMRDMCISMARDENFAALIEHKRQFVNNSSCFLKSSATNMQRRIAAHSRISGYDGNKLLYAPLVKADNPHLRSLLYFIEMNKYRMDRSQEIYIYKNFGLLRVLNLSGIRLCEGHMKRAIGNLIHLRYLGLRYCGLWKRTKKSRFQSSATLPESIRDLKNLYTLDLRHNDMGLRLPNGLWKLENLRHLLLPPLPHASFPLDNLKHLETLKWVPAMNLIGKDAVLEFPSLRNLAIMFRVRKEVEAVFESGLACRCRSLAISIRRAPFPGLESLSGCHHLTKLLLSGEIPENQNPQSLQHNNLEFLPKSLAKLTLRFSVLKQDPMSTLEKLPNLRFLSLEKDAYTGSKMMCSANGFLRLEFLSLLQLTQVEEWEIEEGAMPCLRTLHVHRPLCLKMIPEGFKFVTTIQELELTELGEKLVRRVQVENGGEGEDFHKIQHIPFITVTRSDM